VSARPAVDARKDPATRAGALARIGGQLGINPETLRNWVTQAEIDVGARPGTTTTDAERLGELEREVKELRRANPILRSASAFFASVPALRDVRRGSLASSLPRPAVGGMSSVWLRRTPCWRGGVA
jgi:transposase